MNLAYSTFDQSISLIVQLHYEYCIDPGGAMSTPLKPSTPQRPESAIDNGIDGHQPRLLDQVRDIRDVEKTNIPILLVFESVFRVASMGTYDKYAPIDAP
jgi:hypothetical protein